jgi:hypothetical protein
MLRVIIQDNNRIATKQIAAIVAETATAWSAASASVLTFR